MFDLSKWADFANVFYIPALVAMYGGWIVRFFQKWYAVMRWPDILLLCFGMAVFTVMAIPKFAPYFKPTVVTTMVASPNSAELVSLKDQNGKLKAENARLKRIKPQIHPTVTVIPSPMACPSVTPSFSAKIATRDCSDLLGAQELYDRATVAESATKRTAAHDNAVSTLNDATDNLNRMA